MNKKRIIFNTTDRLDEMIDQIADKRLLNNRSEVIRFCVAEAHRKEFPNYVTTKPKRLTPGEKAELEIEKAEIVKQREADKLIDKGHSLCQELGGTLTPNENACDYKSYSIMPGREVKTTSHTIPLEDLTQVMVDTQYRNLFNETGPLAKDQVLKILNQ